MSNSQKRGGIGVISKFYIATESDRSLATVVGQETCSVWVNMLRGLVPGRRTHRLAPLVAGMLQFAPDSVDVQDTDDADGTTVSQSLMLQVRL